MLMDADLSCLLVVDVQTRLAPAIIAHDKVIANTAVLMKAAARLQVPMLVSEQYPRGLGPTVPELAELAEAGAIVEKVHFSCLADQTYAERFRGLGRGQAVVAGIEAHVCVLQTCVELIEGGYRVCVVADAVSSRTPDNAALALERLRAAGAVVVSTEMVVFEWLRRAGTPEFKELSALIK
jgi:nicotinamidase-related amidase